MSASAPLLGRKQTVGGKFETRAYWGLNLFDRLFSFAAEIEETLISQNFLAFFERWKKSWTPRPHAFAVRAQHHSSVDAPRPSHSAPNTRDDREAPLCGHGTARRMSLIWGIGQCGRAAADWHDGQFAHDTHAGFARRTKTTCPGHINDL